MTVMISEKFYTLTEAAERLQVERHTIWRWVRSGKLAAQKAGGVVFIEKRLVDRLRSAGHNTEAAHVHEDPDQEGGN